MVKYIRDFSFINSIFAQKCPHIPCKKLRSLNFLVRVYYSKYTLTHKNLLCFFYYGYFTCNWIYYFATSIILEIFLQFFPGTCCNTSMNNFYISETLLNHIRCHPGTPGFFRTSVTIGKYLYPFFRKFDKYLIHYFIIKIQVICY